MTENNDVVAAAEDERRGKEEAAAVIPWTIKKYDRNTPSSIVEIRTAFHTRRGVLLMVLLRADGTGSTITGEGSAAANETHWDDITDGIAYVEEKFK